MSNGTASIFARWKSHFTNWREWELNPVVVKELRQSVRSWAVTGMLFLFLLILFFTSLAILVTQSFEISLNPVVGGTIFQAFISILTVASVVFIPIYIGTRLAAERQESNIDLLYVSTLTPGRIIRGKFFCGAYVALLFFSACMPFMAFTNLLRGVDLPTIFFNLVVLFLVVCLAIMASIFFACLPLSRGLKVLIGMFAGFGMFSFAGPMLMFSYEIRSTGIGGMLGEPNFWAVFSTVVGIGMGVMLLLYFLSVALISPPSLNRALPVRVYLTGLWLFTGVLSLVWIRKTGETDIMAAWSMISLAVLIAALVVVASNEDQLSLRVLRTVPEHRAKRWAAFLFYNGAAGGIVWVALLVTATFFLACGILNPDHAWIFTGIKTKPLSPMSLESYDDFHSSLGGFLMYAFAYALAAVLIHRRFLSRRSPKLAGVLVVFLPALLAIVPNLILFFLNQLSWRTVESFQPGNMFNIFSVKDPGAKTMHLICAGTMLFVLTVLNLRWFRRQAGAFRKFDRNPAPPPVIAETVK